MGTHASRANRATVRARVAHLGIRALVGNKKKGSHACDCPSTERRLMRKLRPDERTFAKNKFQFAGDLSAAS